MADTVRSRSDLITLLATNVTGAISAQDVRDYLVSIMPAEAAYANDFWARPLGMETSEHTAAGAVTDSMARGWIQHSQQVEDANSFGDVVYLTPSGTWTLLDIQEGSAILKKVIGINLQSGAAVASGRVLRAGMFRDDAMSVRMLGQVGCPIYIDSNASGQMSVTGGNALSDWRIGYVELWDSAPSLTTGASVLAVAGGAAIRFCGWAMVDSES